MKKHKSTNISFTRVKTMTTVNYPSFVYGTNVYKALVGDKHFPLSPDGGLPLVIEVPLGILAVLLYDNSIIIGMDLVSAKISDDDLDFWRKDRGEKLIRLAGKEIAEDENIQMSLLRDFYYAAEKGHSGIAYKV